MPAARLSKDPRLAPFLSAAADASDHAARWAAEREVPPDERLTTGVWAAGLEAPGGSKGGVAWKVKLTPAGVYESGRGKRRAGGFDVFIELHVGVAGAEPVHKGLLVQAKRLDRLQLDRSERQRLRKQSGEMTAISASGGWVVIFGPKQSRLISAEAVLPALPPDGGTRADVAALWRAAVPITETLMDALDCLTGDPRLPAWTELAAELERPVQYMVEASARTLR